MKPKLIYTNHYNFRLLGINKLHPFDGMKFAKAWDVLSAEFKTEILSLHLEPSKPVADEVLLKLHTQAYLDSLNKAATIAQVIEVWPAKYLPLSFLHKRILTPVKYGCAGTLLATEVALKEQTMAMNFAGGYHHAFADHGEGFCFFADAALAIDRSRADKLLAAEDKVLMIDLDAHRGNGFAAVTANDGAVKNFDMYSFQSYPGLHRGEPDDFPYMIPLKAAMKDETYLNILKTELEKFLIENSDAKLVFYNAGNDIYENDPLGGLSVSFAGVVERDRYVIEQLVKRKIPTVIMTSGGYSEKSFQMIAALARTVINVNKSARATGVE